MSFNETYVRIDDTLTLYTESLGTPGNPAILLIMGAMNQGIFWYDQFCHLLADSGLFVIRYDHRDTGRSGVLDFKAHPYTLKEMTDDAVAILDAYAIDHAHIVGLSMGGYIGQILAVTYPQKVRTLTLISTTADHRPYMDGTMGNFNNNYSLPYPGKKFLDYIERTKAAPPQTADDVLNNQIEGWKVTFGTIQGPDLDALIRLIRLSAQRSKDPYSAFDHGMAVLNSPERTALVSSITAPTFIFHGENDPCLPLPHGEQLHTLIPGSRFEVIKGMGHMFTLSESKYIADKIVHNFTVSR